jgi:hypothetical protein
MLQRLISILPAPERPTGAPMADDWRPVEAELGVRLPDDFKAFLATYGSGVINDLIGISSPTFPPQQGALLRTTQAALSTLRHWRETGRLPYPIHPEPGGLLPWAGTGNGDTYYWLTEPRDEPDRWPVVIFDRGDLDWLRHPGPMSAFLADALERKFAIPCAVYLDDPVEFVPFDPLYDAVELKDRWWTSITYNMPVHLRAMYGEAEDGQLLIERYLGHKALPPRVRETFAAVGIEPPEELVELYASTNGVREDRWTKFLAMHEADRPSTAATILEVAPGLRFPSVEQALVACRHLRANRAGWQPEWWPMFVAPDGHYAVECHGGDRGRVWFVPTDGAPEIRYQRLLDLMELISSRFDTGVWSWSEQEWRFHAEPGSAL